MRHIQVKDEREMAKKAAQLLLSNVLLKENAVLGLATGGTPVGVYKLMAEEYKSGNVSFQHVRTVNLDEYAGLAPEHPQSYRYYMNDSLFHHIDILKENTYVPNGVAADLEQECMAYDALIDALGGIDIQLLGIGNNGHIGFNEPADCFSIGTHIVPLTQSTIEANARYFASPADVPTRALTMGIRNILCAKRIVLIAGASKRDIVHKALYGPVTPSVPASILQLHPDATIISC